MKWAGIPSAILAASALIAAILAGVGFETRQAHGSDVREVQDTIRAVDARVSASLDTLRTQQFEHSTLLSQFRADQRRILCYNQAQAGERPFSDCVLPQ